MDEAVFDIIYEAFYNNEIQTISDLEDQLTDLGLMIVPIEDPTNLVMGWVSE